MREQDWGLSVGYGLGVGVRDNPADEWPPVISSTETI